MKIQNKPLIAPEKNLREFTLRSLLTGIIFAVLFGFSNAYLGLKSGITIAATYPAAIMGIQFLRHRKGSNILEENFLRTIGSIGEAVAGGAIFTIPAFYIAGVWGPEFFASFDGYLKSTAIMLAGGIAGILFVTLLRKVMVEDPLLPFPESVAASEIHKAGRKGTSGAKYLFFAMGVGGVIEFLKSFHILSPKWEKFLPFAKKIIPGTSMEKFKGIETGGGFLLKSPALSPAFLGVGYIIGPKLAALNFAGGVLSWGLFVPLLILILGPQYSPLVSDGVMTWSDISKSVFSNIVKPIAIGGMLMSAAYTLYGLRKKIFNGIRKPDEDIEKTSSIPKIVKRTEKDIGILTVISGIFLLSAFVFVMFWWFMGFKDESFIPALIVALVLMIAGFFFATLSGYLVGVIGSSNNPVSGITITSIVITSFILLMIGISGDQGVIIVLAGAGIICVSAAVAGAALQEMKVGYILGGTPWKMQVGDFIGVIISALAMWIPLFILNAGDLKMAELNGYKGGFGGDVLAAPQAGLMAKLSKGIVGGEMVWPLVIVGIIMAFGFILVKIKSPMLVCVGMYLSFETVAAIFAGGLIRWIVDMIIARRKYSKKQISYIDNRGVLLASGLIAGEALMGLLFAALAFFDVIVPNLWDGSPFIISTAVIIALGFVMVNIPLKAIEE